MGEQRTLTFSQQDIQRLLPHLAVQVLVNAQNTRILMAGEIITYVASKTHPLIKGMLDASANYAEQVREVGRDHKLGPPGIHVFGAMLNHISEENKKSERTDEITKYVTTTLSKQKEVEKHVVQCKLYKMYDKGKMRLQLKITHDVIDDIIAALDAMDFERKWGVGPPTATERAIQSIVDDARART